MMNDKVIDLATIRRLEFYLFIYLFEMCVSNSITLCPIAQNPPLVTYIVSPKENNMSIFWSAQRLITFFW
jgi:hypothetical protein